MLGDTTNTRTEQLCAIGGMDIVSTTLSDQVFVSLSDSAVTELRRKGLKVTRVNKVSAAGMLPLLPRSALPKPQSTLPSMVSVPIQIAGAAEFSPDDMLDLLRLNDFKFSIDPPLTGSGFNIAILGTGIRSTHQLIGGKVIYSKNFTTGPAGDGFDHDTGVAAIIHAVVPDAGILDMKVLDDTGNGTEEYVVLALEECATLLYTNPDIAPNVINLSLGSVDDNNPDNPMRVSCKAVMGMGIVIVAAAGNNGAVAGAVTVPACEKYVVAVGSMSTSPFQVSDFSSRGPTRGGLVKPDVVFLGEDLIIASSSSDLATRANSGTSFSTPLTTGVMVLTMEGIVRTQDIPPEIYVGRNVLTNTMIIDEMLPTVCTKPEGAPTDKDNDYGYGVPVGNLIQRDAGPGLYIDINRTVGLCVFFMMTTMLTRMMKVGGS